MGLGETTNVAFFYGPISDILGSSDSRTHATMSSGHVVHRAQTRAPASRDIYGQRVARAPPCSRRCYQLCMIVGKGQAAVSDRLATFACGAAFPKRAYRCQQASPFFLSSRKRTRDKIWVHSLPAIKSEIKSSVRGRRFYLTRSPRPFLGLPCPCCVSHPRRDFPTSQ